MEGSRQAAKQEAAALLQQAREQVETEKETHLTQARDELEQQRRACQERVEAASDRFVELFLEAPDA